LAVKGVDAIKSNRCVKALLMKGANRDVKDNNGRRPLDLVDSITH